jgi:Glycosyl hydrolases family 16
MSPRDQNEEAPLGVSKKSSNEATPLTQQKHEYLSFQQDGDNKSSRGISTKEQHNKQSTQKIIVIATLSFIFAWICCDRYYNSISNNTEQSLNSSMVYPKGSYKLVERQVGESFFDSYDFWDGPDSVGSAGYNIYVGKHRAMQLGLVNVTTTENNQKEQIVYMSSAPTSEGPRESIRLEGKKRYNHGLFIVDLLHMPAGCGQWPAFWLTDDDDGKWPVNGEIDIVEGINYQSNAKTALHTSGSCSMWQQVPPYATTGHWDRADGLFDRYTGIPQNDSSLPADNCYVKAPHQWGNQGCVAISDHNNTIGAGFNDQEGGIYVLEWDPANGYIRSWVFPRLQGIPDDLASSITDSQATGEGTTSGPTPPNPNDSSWGIPYAYFAIGDHSDCSADHFQNMRLIFNLAFCGTVAGNRYFTDCPAIVEKFPPSPSYLHNDPVAACNAYIRSNPDELNEAYWKIKGVHVFQRS